MIKTRRPGLARPARGPETAVSRDGAPPAAARRRAVDPRRMAAMRAAKDPRRRPPRRAVHPRVLATANRAQIPVVTIEAAVYREDGSACDRCDASRIVPQLLVAAKEFLRQLGVFPDQGLRKPKSRRRGGRFDLPFAGLCIFRYRSASVQCRQRLTSPSTHRASGREPARASPESRKTPRRSDAESRRLFSCRISGNWPIPSSICPRGEISTWSRGAPACTA